MSRSGGSIENILDNLSTANYHEDVELSCTADVKWTWNGFLESRTYDPTTPDYRETIIYGLSIKYGPYQPNETVVKLMRKDLCAEKTTWTDSITMVNSSNKSWTELEGISSPAQPLKINPYEDGQEDGVYWKFSIAGADSTSLRYWFRHRMFKFYPVRDSKHNIFAYPAESKALVGWIPVDAANEKRYKAFIIYGSYQPEKHHWQGVFTRSDQDTAGVWIARKFESMKSHHVEFTLREKSGVISRYYIGDSANILKLRKNTLLLGFRNPLMWAKLIGTGDSDDHQYLFGKIDSKNKIVKGIAFQYNEPRFWGKNPRVWTAKPEPSANAQNLVSFRILHNDGSISKYTMDDTHRKIFDDFIDPMEFWWRYQMWGNIKLSGTQQAKLTLKALHRTDMETKD